MVDWCFARSRGGSAPSSVVDSTGGNDSPDRGHAVTLFPLAPGTANPLWVMWPLGVSAVLADTDSEGPAMSTLDTEGPAQGTEGAEKKSPKLKPHGVSQAGKVEHFTAEERAARGKAARAEVPRRVHAEWEPPPHRPDPVVLLGEQDETRVPELVPIRYGRMLVSPFTFYRGAAALMASDLAGGPRSGLHVQLCGDAHLSNFGSFAAPDRRLT